MLERVAAVTGGVGFIGSHLCDALIERGDYVICIDNLSGTDGSTRNIDHLFGLPNFEFIETDILEWTPGSRMADIDCLYHQAASKSVFCRVDPRRDLMVNAMGTLRLLQMAERYEVRKFVHASTGSVYGLDGLSEGSRREPRSFYGISKTAAESYCALFDLDCTVLRYFHVIGPRQGGTGVVPTFIRNCLNGEPITIFGTGGQVRSFTSVHDVVAANLWASQHESQGCDYYNCASGIKVTIQELAEFIMAEMGSCVPIEYDSSRPGDRLDCDVQPGIAIHFDQDWQGVVREAIAEAVTRCES